MGRIPDHVPVVKLVPLIFMVHLLLTGKRAAAVRGLAVFVGLQGLALVIRPQDHALLGLLHVADPTIGPAQLPANQSLDGLIVKEVTDMSLWVLARRFGDRRRAAVPVSC